MPDPIRVLITVRRRAPSSTWQEAWDQPGKIVTRALLHLGHADLVSPADHYLYKPPPPSSRNTPADSSSSPYRPAESPCCLMLVERWDPVIFIVFDLFHTRYNPADAHISGRNDLPVITLVRISRRDRIRSFSPRPIDVVNEALCQAHDENGWEGRPPFREDRAGGAPRPVYAHPRSGERTQ